MNWARPERKSWNAWMHREWTASRCICVALNGAFILALGVLLMIITQDRPEGGLVDQASSILMCLVFAVVGVVQIGLAKRHWVRLRPVGKVGKDAIHPLE